MVYTGERVVPWDFRVGANLMHHHVARYAWAVPFAYRKNVVDLGCGAGYGSFMMSWSAKSVAGIDVSEDAISFAAAHFTAPNLSFEVGDITWRRVPADLFVAFEVLEHLDNPQVVIERCRPMLWSIPVSSANQFHRRMYTVNQTDKLMKVGEWFQGRDGLIVRREVAWFEPTYVLGFLK